MCPHDSHSSSHFNFLYGFSSSRRSSRSCAKDSRSRPDPTGPSKSARAKRSAHASKHRGITATTTTTAQAEQQSHRLLQVQDRPAPPPPPPPPPPPATTIPTQHKHHPPPPMQPFRDLASTVRHCPWGGGGSPTTTTTTTTTTATDDIFFPPAPRSIRHDTAVSLLVTDRTRPEQPQFVIACPLEHVDLVRGLVAPDGSGRALTARGASGQPRSARHLRSMLLDGTPNVELAIDASGGGGNGHVANPGGGGGGGAAAAAAAGPQTQPVPVNSRPPPPPPGPFFVGGQGTRPDSSQFPPVGWVAGIPVMTRTWDGAPVANGDGDGGAYNNNLQFSEGYFVPSRKP